MEALQTPYFIIDEAILQKYYHMLTDSLRQSWGNYLIGYSLAHFLCKKERRLCGSRF